MDDCAYQDIRIGDGSGRETVKSWKPLCRQALVCVGVWTVYFTPGLFIGVPPVYIAHTRREANSSEAVNLEMASWLSSSFCWGAVPWVFILPAIAHYFGRKIVFYVLSINSIACYIILYCSQSVMQVIFSEIMSGMTIAAHMSVTVMIIAEYTSPQYRGVFLTLKSAIMYWGIWVANAIGTFSHWRNIATVGLVSCLFCGTSLFWPESPYWLASKGKFDRCAISHRWLRGVDSESEKELHMLMQSRKDEIIERLPRKNTIRRYMNVIRLKEVYRPLFISLPLLALYHCSGKLVCTLYILEIIKDLTKSESTAYLVMLLLDGATVVGMYIGCAVSKIFRRRTILLGCTSIGILCLYIVSLYLYLIELGVINKHNILLILLLIGYSIFISVGPMLMITTIYGEILPFKFAHEACIFVGLFDIIFATIMIKCAPYIFITLGLHGAFLFYSITSTILTIILYKYLPETKDKTLQEISNWFRGEEVNQTDESKHLNLRVNQRENDMYLLS